MYHWDGTITIKAVLTVVGIIILAVVVLDWWNTRTKKRRVKTEPASFGEDIATYHN